MSIFYTVNEITASDAGQTSLGLTCYYIIYPSMLSVLMLLISQSVIRCSGSPHCGFLNPYHPPLKRMTCTQCSSQYTRVIATSFILHRTVSVLSIVMSFILHRTKSTEHCDVIHIAPYKICTKYFICFKMEPTNPTPKHKQSF